MMNSVDRLSPVPGLGSAAAAASTADLARAMIGDVGARLIGWSAALGGRADDARHWSAVAGASVPQPDLSRLSQGGDIYGLRDLASTAARQLGATPAQEGQLLRALEDFTRAAALNHHALAGGDSALTALSDAWAGIGDDNGLAGAGDGLDGLVARLDIATRRLEQANL